MCHCQALPLCLLQMCLFCSYWWHTAYFVPLAYLGWCFVYVVPIYPFIGRKTSLLFVKWTWKPCPLTSSPVRFANQLPVKCTFVLASLPQTLTCDVKCLRLQKHTCSELICWLDEDLVASKDSTLRFFFHFLCKYLFSIRVLLVCSVVFCFGTWMKPPLQFFVRFVRKMNTTSPWSRLSPHSVTSILQHAKKHWCEPNNTPLAAFLLLSLFSCLVPVCVCVVVVVGNVVDVWTHVL